MLAVMRSVADGVTSEFDAVTQNLPGKCYGRGGTPIPKFALPDGDGGYQLEYPVLHHDRVCRGLQCASNPNAFPVTRRAAGEDNCQIDVAPLPVVAAGKAAEEDKA